jgi:hypothetical protein
MSEAEAVAGHASMSGHIDARPRMFQEASFCDDPEGNCCFQSPDLNNSNFTERSSVNIIETPSFTLF